MTSGDYSLRANNRDIEGSLAEFNDLLNGLANQLLEQSQISREQQILLSKITDQIDVAIVAIDHNQSISLMNPTAETLFGQGFNRLEGWPAKALGLQRIAEQALNKGVKKVTEFEINKTKRKVYVRTDNYFSSGKEHALIFITDIQNLLREEERQAWQKLLRVLSHEINNSLTPIASISDTLTQEVINQKDSASPLNSTLKEGLSVITERAHSLNHFIQEYRQFTHLPLPAKEVFSARDFFQKITQLFEASHFDFPAQDLNLYADCEQLQQAFVNLLKNAEEANLAKTDNTSTITLNWFVISKMIYIEICDQGEGVNNEDNIFVPFYTTKKQGSGIGLALSRQIALNHGGDLTLTNHIDTDTGNISGAKATMMLPVSQLSEHTSKS